MSAPLRTILCSLMILTLALRVNAQPPDISRWTGGTANAQAQGFNMGDPLVLTWGFAAPGTSINDSAFSGFANSANVLQTRLNNIYGNQSVWQPLFQSVTDRWSAISGLSFQYEAADDGASYIINGNSSSPGILGVRADLRIGGKPLDGNGGVLAYNYLPNIGDMVIDTTDNVLSNTASNSQALRFIVAHEMGHGLGIRHVESSDQAFLMEPFIQTTIDGPAYHDILTIQNGYGDALEKSNNGFGNDVVGNATSLGTLVLGGDLSIGNDARNLLTNVNTTDFISIDNDTDTDYFSFTTTTPGSINITLDSLGFTYRAGVQFGPQISFDTTIRSDLRFSLLDTDGTTILANVNSFGFGNSETLNGFNLSSAGTYYVRVQGSSNPDASTLDTQFFGLSVGLVSAVPEPSSLALLLLVACARYAFDRRKLA